MLSFEFSFFLLFANFSGVIYQAVYSVICTWLPQYLSFFSLLPFPPQCSTSLLFSEPGEKRSLSQKLNNKRSIINKYSNISSFYCHKSRRRLVKKKNTERNKEKSQRHNGMLAVGMMELVVTTKLQQVTDERKSI